MKQLFSVYDMNGHIVEFLDILSLIAILFGIIVIINKNPIGSLISLIGLFGAISIYLILLGLTFIGFSYLIVYIGAVSILFLFILMLINVRTSELQSNNSNSIPLALFISILLNYSLFQVLPYYILAINSSFNYLMFFSSINKHKDLITKTSEAKELFTMYISSNN
jgi:NADH-ubiquinone oxidoreductase chain 6